MINPKQQFLGQVEQFINKRSINLNLKRNLIDIYSDKESVKIDSLFKISPFVEVIENYILISISITNKTNEDITLHSINISEFLFELKRPIDNYFIHENGWLQSSPTRNLSLRDKSNPSIYFLKRDTNPYSYDEKFGCIPNSIVSEWYTFVKDEAGDECMFIGNVTTSKQYCQIFSKLENNDHLRVRITGQCDNIVLKPGESFTSEKIFLGFGKYEDISNKFASILKNEMDVVLNKPPHKGICCSYYANANNVSEKYILDQLKIIQEKNLDINYIQIDAGYAEFGNWLTPTSRFPSGLNQIFKEILNAGHMPGIWISPIIATKKGVSPSEKPDWYMKIDGKILNGRLSSPFDEMIPQMMYLLDVSNNEYQEYIQRVIEFFIKDLGVKLIKLDFLYSILTSECYSQKNITRVQALRGFLKIIKDFAGEDIYLLSAIAPLSPLVGIVDSARMGYDPTSPFTYSIPFLNTFVNTKLFNSNIVNYWNRDFLDGTIWWNDPDCLVVSPITGLPEDKVDEYFNLIKEPNVPKFIGDDLTLLDESYLERYIYPIFRN